MKLFDLALGWATPVVPHFDQASLAQYFGHVDPEHNCLPRQQGKCPGLEYCPDCEWREGTSREAD